MKLVKVIIQGLKYFTLSEIKKIEIDLKAPVNIILGSNGSGKSSLLRAIGFLPANRKDYHQDGFIEHYFKDNENEIVLGSYFKNKSKPHSFKLNGEELNPSGVTQIQIELLEKHLRYTENVRDLSFMMMDFVHMTASQRKEFFVNTSPVDLSFTMDTFKRVSSKLREISNNVTLLHSRREELSSKLLSNEEYSSLNREVKSLEDDITWINKYIYGLAPFITDIKNKRKMLEDPKVDVDKVISDLKGIYKHLPYFSTLDKDNVEENSITLKNTIYHLSLNRDTLVSDIRVKSDEVDKLEASIKEANIDNKLSKETELSSLLNLIKENTPSDKYLTLDDKLVESTTDNEIDEIRNILSNVMIESVDRLLSTERFTRAKNLLRLHDERIGNGTAKIEMVDERIKELSQVALPNSTCTMTCGLKSLHEKTHGNVKDKVESLSKSRDKMIKLLNTLKYKRANLSKIVENNTLVRKSISVILDSVYHKYPIVSSVLDKEQFTNYLVFQPGTIISLIVNTLENNRRRILYLKYKAEADKLNQEILVLKAKTNVSKKYLEDTLTKTKEVVSKMIKDLNTLDKTISDTKELLSRTNHLKSITEMVKHYKSEVDSLFEVKVLDANIKYHEDLYSTLSLIKDRYNDKRITLEIKLKENDSTLSKYQEIKSTLEEVEKDRWKYELIQAATSPQGIPKKYLLEYINSSIVTVNRLLANIFSYPLELSEVSDTEDINFMFPVTTESGRTDDLKFLSTGQKQIVNLAWNLSHLMRLSSLNVIPLVLDEIRSGMDHGHSGKLLTFIQSLVDQGIVSQVMMVDHGSLCLQSFSNCDYICLREDGCLLPDAPLNTHVKITHR